MIFFARNKVSPKAKSYTTNPWEVKIIEISFIFPNKPNKVFSIYKTKESNLC